MRVCCLLLILEASDGCEQIPIDGANVLASELKGGAFHRQELGAK